jgi:acetate kinase
LNGPVLVVNSGSSSLKAALFTPDGARRDFRYTHIGYGRSEQEATVERLVAEIGQAGPAAVGHRIVHGGDAVEPARRIDRAERERLDRVAHLAPLHMPNNLMGVDVCMARWPHIPHFACFDTAFHRTMPESARRLPLPAVPGLEKYGFHGINFAHIARVLPRLLPDAAALKIVVAHLGSGVSLCLLENLRSRDTTMGLTPLGGIPGGTRSGDLDPGVVLELMGRHGREELTDLLYHRSGLLALSGGLSPNMAELLQADTLEARFAVDYFCDRVRAGIGAYAARAGGIDALVFTAGIGENSPAVRAGICEPLAFLGLRLDPKANARGDTFLSAAGSKPILRIPADEESMIAAFVKELLPLPAK